MHAAPQGLWTRRNHLRLLVLALLLFIVNSLAQVTIFALTDDLFLAVLASNILTVLLPCLLLARRAGGTLASEFQLGRCRIDLVLWSGLAAIAVVPPAFQLATISTRLHPMPPDWFDAYARQLPDTPLELGITIMAAMIIAPLTEELLFRGLIHRLARRQWGAGGALVISSLVFGMAHFEPWYLFGLIAVGALLAFIYDATGSLTACVTAHIVYNGLSLSLMLTGPREAPDDIPEAGGFDLPAALLVFASCGVLVYICRKLKRNGRMAAEQARRAKMNGPDGFPPDRPEC